jgi:hypothetical protein
MPMQAATGDVHQHIDAVVFRFDLVESRRYFGFLSQIDAKKLHFRAAITKVSNHPSAGIAIDIQNGDSVVFPQAIGDRKADSPGSAGYDSDFPHTLFLPI